MTEDRKFIEESEDLLFSQCIRCKNYRRDGTCKAFPEGIPEEILLNKKDHRKPIEGDNGIQFDPKDPDEELPKKWPEIT